MDPSLLSAAIGLLQQRLGTNTPNTTSPMPWMQQPRATTGLLNPRMNIGPSGPQQRALEPQQQPQQPTSPSQAMFQAYMSQIFNQKYTPQGIPGIYGQYPGGYSGFMPPQMPAGYGSAQQPTAPRQTDPYTGLPVWNYLSGTPQPSGLYMTARSPVSGY